MNKKDIIFACIIGVSIIIGAIIIRAAILQHAQTIDDSLFQHLKFNIT